MRKEALKAVITGCLKQSVNMQDFTKKATAQGYAIELGRGIAFTDAQAVRIKGSEVGYALLSIEKQLIRNRRMQQEEQQKPSLAQQLNEVMARSQKEQIEKQQDKRIRPTK
jgi:hypothetical protein